MRIDVVSIFPAYFDALDLSLPGKARDKGLLDLRTHDLRDFTHDRHRTVDDTPYGGGAGMVMRPEPWGEALEEALRGTPDRPVLVVPTPSGEPFHQRTAEELAGRAHLVFACGRYEGIDQRVIDDAAERFDVREVSLGDYVLNGGEVAALAIIEAVVRLLPGFMGNAESLAEESHGADGLLEYPVYTKPRLWREREVPAVLLSGDHGRIAAWRREESVRRTARRRPDLRDPSHAEGEWTPVRATRGDAAELLVLQRACWLQEALANERLDIAAMHETFEEVLAGFEEWETWVVRASTGRLVGAVRGRLLGSTWEIGRLMVAADLQGRGLGRWLLEFIEGRAPEAAVRFTLFTGARSGRNLRMYRRAGYRPRRDGEGPAGAVSLTKRRSISS